MCSNHGNIGDSLTAAEKLSAEHEKFSDTAKVGYHCDLSQHLPHVNNNNFVSSRHRKQHLFRLPYEYILLSSFELNVILIKTVSMHACQALNLK